MFESWLFGIVLAAVISILLAIILVLITYIPTWIYTAFMFMYFGYKGIKYHKNFILKRELINATRLYKALLTRQDVVEFL